MRPVSAERPLSAISLSRNQRQRLQNPATRRVHASEKDQETTRTNLTLDPSYLLQVNEQKQQYHGNPPMNIMGNKKMHRNIIEVQIRCIFLRVGDIDTLNERFYAELLLEASWDDPAFKQGQTRPFDPDVNWTPELELINGIGELKDETTYSVRFNKHGLATVTEHHQLKGTLWERMELHHFPLDVQSLSIMITTSRANSEMKFVKNLKKPSGVNRRIFTDEQEWDLFEHVTVQVSQQIDEHIDDGNNHSVVTCSCSAARKYGYYMWNGYFLIFLITSASFGTFPIPLANIQGRIQISCTLLLTSITFRWLCNKSLPTISYLTAVDVYAIGSIFSVCLLNIFHGVIGYVNYYMSTNLAVSSSSATTSLSYIIIIDRWALAVFTILFFSYQFATLVWMYLVPGKKRRMLFRQDKEHPLNIAAHYTNPKTKTSNAFTKGKRTEDTFPQDSRVVSNVDF